VSVALDPAQARVGHRRLMWYLQRKGLRRRPRTGRFGCTPSRSPARRRGPPPLHPAAEPPPEREGGAESPDRHRGVLPGPPLSHLLGSREGASPVQRVLQHRPAPRRPSEPEPAGAAAGVSALPGAAPPVPVSGARAEEGTGGNLLPMFDRSTKRHGPSVQSRLMHGVDGTPAFTPFRRGEGQPGARALHSSSALRAISSLTPNAVDPYHANTFQAVSIAKGRQTQPRPQNWINHEGYRRGPSHPIALALADDSVSLEVAPCSRPITR